MGSYEISSLYIYGKEFTVRTDHEALKWLYNHKDPKSRLSRWKYELEDYSQMKIIHRKGTLHINADGLSRLVATNAMLKRTNWNEEQNRDHFVKNVIKLYRSKDHFSMINGVFTRLWNDNRTIRHFKQIVVPQQLRDIIMKDMHENDGHWGIQKTYEEVGNVSGGLVCFKM